MVFLLEQAGFPQGPIIRRPGVEREGLTVGGREPTRRRPIGERHPTSR
jgi:hypothetical protein